MGVCRTIIASVLVGGGLILFVLGFAVKFAIFPVLLESMVYENLDLREGTEAYDGFVEPPVPVYMTFHFFNITNPDEFRNGAKPIVAEIGPHVYREVRRKENIQEVNGDMLKYGLYMEYHYDESKSCTGCSKDDPIYVLNAPLAVVAGLYAQIPTEATVEDLWNNFFPDTAFPPELAAIKDLVIKETLSPLLNENLNGENEACPDCADDIVSLTTVDELLYAGYKNGMMNTLLLILNFFAPIIGIDVDQVLDMLPEQISGGYFGLFKGKNATKLDSYYTVNNGRYEPHKLLQYIEVNGATKLPDSWWPDVAPTPSAQESGLKGVCKEIYGNDGTQFPPFVDKEIRLWLYVSELCRSIWLDFDQEVEVRGIEAYRYRPPFSVFDMRNPDNFCYCPEFMSCAKANETLDMWNPWDCYDFCSDGMLRVGNCYGGVPVIMTAPHFWNADKKFLDDVNGVNPIQDKHDTMIDIEPITGIALAAHKRIQVNMRVDPWSDLTLTQKLPKVGLMPILWADEGADLDEENADKFNDMVTKPTNIVNGLAIAVGIVLGAVMFCAGMFEIIRSRKQSGSKA